MLVTLPLLHLMLLLRYVRLSTLNYVKLPINRTEEYIWILDDWHYKVSGLFSAVVGLQIGLSASAIDFSLYAIVRAKCRI